MLDNLDKKIINIMQDDFPLVPEPYKYYAEKLNITEDELIYRLQSYKKHGQMRKMGAVLKHREVGFKANALCAWIVPEERIELVGQIMIKTMAVTHCYSRLTVKDWPYNFYTMIHAQNREDCEKIAQKLAEDTGIYEYKMLFSTREWKKTSMKYFKELSV